MHSHKYAVRFGLVSLEMVNCLVWIIVNTLLHAKVAYYSVFLHILHFFVKRYGQRIYTNLTGL